METNNHQHQPPEQMNWVDYCDSLSNEHSWPKLQVRQAFRILDRMPDAAPTAPHKREGATELT